jgi:hypothetical protein
MTQWRCGHKVTAGDEQLGLEHGDLLMSRCLFTDDTPQVKFHAVIDYSRNLMIFRTRLMSGSRARISMCTNRYGRSRKALTMGLIHSGRPENVP